MEIEQRKEIFRLRDARQKTIEWAKEQSNVEEEVRESIQGMDFAQLKQALQDGKVTAEDVVRVYYGLAVRAHRKTNCLTSIIQKSLDEAKELDERAKDGSYSKPPLFGIPISIKESISLKDCPNTWGLVQQSTKKGSEDSYTVMKLKEDGMIPFCQTNVATLGITYNCANLIYGATKHPNSTSRTSGGSSGGEGALISHGGSLLGLGNDVGGSIRIPAAYSGCSGFKPTSTRFSTLQALEHSPLHPLMGSEGPMARDPHVIVEILRSIWSGLFLSERDPMSVPVDFRNELYEKKLCIGYFNPTDYIKPLHGNQRALRDARNLLSNNGYEVKDLDVKKLGFAGLMKGVAKGIFASIYADGGSKFNEMLKKEPKDEAIESLMKWVSMSDQKKPKNGDTFTTHFYDSLPKSPKDVKEGLDQVCEWRRKVIKMMKEQGVDVLLCPSTISPALPHSAPNEMPITAIMSMMIWNAMDFPAGVVTTSEWTQGDTKAMTGLDKEYPEKGAVEKKIREEAKGYEGLPLSVQLVAPCYRDESVLRVMCDLYDVVKGKKGKKGKKEGGGECAN